MNTKKTEKNGRERGERRNKIEWFRGFITVKLMFSHTSASRLFTFYHTPPRFHAEKKITSWVSGKVYSN